MPLQSSKEDALAVTPSKQFDCAVCKNWIFAEWVTTDCRFKGVAKPRCMKVHLFLKQDEKTLTVDYSKVYCGNYVKEDAI